MGHVYSQFINIPAFSALFMTFKHFIFFSYVKGSPKIESALGKHLELALHGFQMGIFTPKYTLIYPV